MASAPVTSYIYAGSNLDFEKKDLTNIKINKPGWGFVFNVNGKMSDVFTAGVEVSLLKKTFPKSPLKKGEDGVQIWLKDNDSYVFFEVKNGTIKSIRYTVDES